MLSSIRTRAPSSWGWVNATPDSFSDGGRCLSEDSAVARGLRMWRQGAHIVDVGGESTRPGAAEVSEKEELRRVVGVVARLASAGVLVSIDTSKPGVAEAAIEAGAAVLNDITALEDPGMARVCASAGVGVVLMHMRGNPRTMQIDPAYADVVTEVGEYLRRRIGAATAAGVDRQAIAVDPGIGFGKTLHHNLALLNGLPDLAELGRPVLGRGIEEGLPGRAHRPVRAGERQCHRGGVGYRGPCSALPS